MLDNGRHCIGIKSNVLKGTVWLMLVERGNYRDNFARVLQSVNCTGVESCELHNLFSTAGVEETILPLFHVMDGYRRRAVRKLGTLYYNPWLQCLPVKFGPTMLYYFVFFSAATPNGNNSTFDVHTMSCIVIARRRRKIFKVYIILLKVET